MGADTRLAYIRYTRARVRRLAVVVAGMAAVAVVAASRRRVWWRGGAYQVADHRT